MHEMPGPKGKWTTWLQSHAERKTIWMVIRKLSRNNLPPFKQEVIDSSSHKEIEKKRRKRLDVTKSITLGLSSSLASFPSRYSELLGRDGTPRDNAWTLKGWTFLESWGLSVHQALSMRWKKRDGKRLKELPFGRHSSISNAYNNSLDFRISLIFFLLMWAV
jgi:hypothetical protein